MTARITYDQYDEMYYAYVEQQSEAYVHKKTGISTATVRKYINDGDPEHAMEPIKTRWERAMRSRQKKQDLDLSKAKDILGVTVYNFIAKIAQKSRELDLAEVNPSKLPRMLVDLQTVLRYVIGDSDVNISDNSRFKKFEHMTKEELVEYWKTGIDKDDILSDPEE